MNLLLVTTRGVAERLEGLEIGFYRGCSLCMCCVQSGAPEFAKLVNIKLQ